jgi:hypothetical protein
MATKESLRIRRWTPTPEQAEYLKAIEPTQQFLDNLPDDVRQQYAGQWIAVKDAQIIASAPTCAELHDKLGKLDDPTILDFKLESGLTIRWRYRS